MIEKLQRIPFIRESPCFKDFFNLNRRSNPDPENDDITLNDLEIEEQTITNPLAMARKDRATTLLNNASATLNQAVMGIKRESP